MQEEHYEKARKIVRKKKRFYHHLKAYFIINAAFLLLMLSTGDHPGEWFPVMILWGIGLMFHYVGAFGIPGTKLLTPEWEKEEIERTARKLSGHQHPEASNPTEEHLELKELERRYRDSDLV